MGLCGQVAIISIGRLVVFESGDEMVLGVGSRELRAGMHSALRGVEQGQRFKSEATLTAILKAGSCRELTQEL
jgi:hypothetical protein